MICDGLLCSVVVTLMLLLQHLHITMGVGEVVVVEVSPMEGQGLGSNKNIQPLQYMPHLVRVVVLVVEGLLEAWESEMGSTWTRRGEVCSAAWRV